MGNNLLHFGDGFGKGWLGDVGQQNIGTFTGEEDGGFETDTTESQSAEPLLSRISEKHSPSGTSDDSILALETTHGADWTKAYMC